MIKKIISALILILFIWQIWSFNGRNQPLQESQVYIDTIQEINPSDSLGRSILGIQPYMIPSDYFSPSVFEHKLRKYLREAQAKGLIKEQTLVLFPENVGSWLVLEGEKHSIAEKKTLKEALKTMVMSNFFEMAVFAFRASEDEDLTKSAIFRMKSRKMAKGYVSTFSNLAKEFHVHIVAGSIILAGPEVSNGGLIVDEADPLYNVSLIFDPEGNIVGGPIKKSFPSASEQTFVHPSNEAQAPIFKLPMGQISVLIGLDSWYSTSYDRARKSDVILVPSFLNGDQIPSKPWEVHSGYDLPVEVDPNDLGKLSNHEARMKYALPGKISGTSAQVGMNVFLRGELWDLGAIGQPIAIYQGNPLTIRPSERGGIWALNF